MQKITKKEFTEILTNNLIRITVLDNKALSIEECLIDFVKKHKADIDASRTRTAQKDGKYIRFSDDSLLSIGDNAYNIYNAYKGEIACYTVLAIEHEWYDECDKCTRYKTMYYFTV